MRRLYFRREILRTFFVTFFVAGGLWILAIASDAILENGVRNFDSGILLAMRDANDRSDPLGPRWLEQVARDITSLGSTTVMTLITLSVAGFLALTGRRLPAMVVVVAIGGGALLSRALKHGFDRPRPDLVPHAVEVYSASFPSGHAMMSAICYLTLGALLASVEANKRTRVYVLTWSVLLTALVGSSRVYLGVHWPTDVVAGWCVGSAWAILCCSVESRLPDRGAM